MNRCYRVITAALALITCSSLALSSLGIADPLSNEAQNDAKSWSFSTPNGIFATLPEVEPNNSLATAQPLGCNNVMRPASLQAGAAPPDTDYVSFTANAGDIVSIGTDADGTTGQAGDTRIRLFNSSGVVLASDDDSGPGAYSLIANFVVPSTGVYYVGIAAFSTQTGSYRAFIACCGAVAPLDDTCAGATPIVCGNIDLSGNTACYTNNYTPLTTGTGGCTGFTALGRDVVYQMTVSGGDELNVIYTSTGDASIYIVTDCSNPTTTCVAGADATFSGQAEVLNYQFTSSGTYYLILDTFGTNTGGLYSLVGELRCAIVPNLKASWGQVKVLYR